jgi:hypothetical protein
MVLTHPGSMDRAIKHVSSFPDGFTSVEFCRMAQQIRAEGWAFDQPPQS